MGKNKRRNFRAEFKAKIPIEAIKEQKTLSELAAELHPSQITEWKRQFQALANSIFSSEAGEKFDKEAEDTAKLYEQIGRLQVENAF